MKTAEEYNDYKREYNKEKYSKVSVYFPRAEKDAIQKYCSERDTNMNDFIKSLIYAEMGDILSKVREETAPDSSEPINVYLTSQRRIIAVCGKRYLIMYPNDSGFKLGVKVICSTGADRLKEKLSKQKVDCKAFERWNDIADEKGELSEDIPDIEALAKSLNDTEYVSVYPCGRAE